MAWPLRFRPPSWRSDLEREIDLIEEVARIHGYEHIPEDRPVAVSSSPRGARERVESAVREVLSGAGFDEAVTFSLVEDRLAVPVRPGPAICAVAGRSFQPEAGSGTAAKLDSQPAGCATAQRDPRPFRRRAVRDRQRLSGPSRGALCQWSRRSWRS